MLFMSQWGPVKWWADSCKAMTGAGFGDFSSGADLNATGLVGDVFGRSFLPRRCHIRRQDAVRPIYYFLAEPARVQRAQFAETGGSRQSGDRVQHRQSACRHGRIKCRF